MTATPTHKERYEAVALDVFGSAAAVVLYERVIDAAHAFARASKCPAGANVVDWAAQKGAEVQTRWIAGFAEPGDAA